MKGIANMKILLLILLLPVLAYSYEDVLKMSKGGTGSAAFASGGMCFSDGTKLTTDATKIFWDNTSKRLGIGGAPSFQVHTISTTAAENVLTGGISTTPGNGARTQWSDGTTGHTIGHASAIWGNGSPDLGINAGNAKNMRFYTSNLDRMMIDSTGKVIIASAPADGQLNVKGGRSYFSANSEKYAIGARYIDTGGTVYFGAANDGPGGSALPDATISAAGGNEVARFTNAGLVGVGTGFPQSLLTLGKTSPPTSIARDTMYLKLGAGEATLNSFRLIGLGYSTTSLTHVPAYMGYMETDQGGNTKGALIFGTRDATTDTQPIERMRIDSAGNVGINTSSTINALLDVNGNAGARGKLHVNYAAGGCSYSTPTLGQFSVTDVNDRIEAYSTGTNIMGLQARMDCGATNSPLSLNSLGGNVYVGSVTDSSAVIINGSGIGVNALPIGGAHKFYGKTVSGDARMKLESTGANNYDQSIEFADPSSSWFVGNRFAGDVLGFGIGRTSTKDDLIIDSAGRVAMAGGSESSGPRLLVQGLGETISGVGSKLATMRLTDTGGGAGNGGAVEFAANSASYFAAIKGNLVNGSSNMTGHMEFYTRNAISDPNATLRMSIFAGGGVSINDTAGGTGNVPHNCANVITGAASGTVLATCPAGKIATGGGCWSQTSTVAMATAYMGSSTAYTCQRTDAGSVIAQVMCCTY